MAWLSLLGELLFIFFARVTDVSLSTVRFMMMVRGKRLLAAVIGLAEIAIWVLALGRVLQGLEDPIKVVFYCLGFASGIYVGQWLEEKLAIGVCAVQIIPHDHERANNIWERLRAAGFGVTVLTGEGRYGPRRVLLVTSHRKGVTDVIGTARELDPRAFVTIMDAKTALGGTGTMRFRK